MLRTAATLAALLTLPACTWLQDRGRDAADIFSIGVGFGTGAKGQVGPMALGILWSEDFAMVRGGEAIYLDPFESLGSSERYQEFTALLVPAQRFVPPGLAAARGKELVVHEGLFRPDRGVIPSSARGIPPAPYWTNLEVVAGAGITLRAGLNPGEILDFLLGWFGVDIYGDDVGPWPPPEPTAPPEALPSHSR